MKNLFRTPILGTLLIVLLLPMFVAVFPAKVAAAPYSKDDFVTQANAWMLGRAVSLCFNNHGTYTTRDPDQADNGEWMTNDSSPVGEFVGWLVEGNGSDDDKVDCQSVVRKMLEYTGLSGPTILCEMGYTRQSSDKTGQSCLDGSGYYSAPTDITSGSSDARSKAKDLWNDAFRKLYLENRNFGDTITKPMKFYIFLHSFNQFCGNGESAGGAIDVNPWNNKDDISSKQAYHAPWYFDDSSTYQDSYITTSGDNDEDSTLILGGYGLIDEDGPDDRMSCGELIHYMVEYGPDFKEALDTFNAGGGTIPGVHTGGDNISIDATCGATDGDFFEGLKFWANPLNWLICPLITGMTALTRVLDTQIVGMLCINEKDVFTGVSAAASTCGKASSTATTTSAGYKSAWNVFRILSLGLLAIAALIMVLSQTSGFEIVDAYTIRKTLPRILIAGIGITLSWALLQWFVGLTNDLGVGVRGLIYAPFQGAVGNGDVVLTGGGGAIGKLLANVYLISLGAFGFLTLLATGALAVIIAFAVLTIRNMLVILLLITAPIAIAAYVLPNTQNIWKTWWSFFSKALMVFPIITAFIAIGHVFAALSVKQGGLFNSLIGFAAYFAPYFLLPATFRFAGGALATIGGFANDRGRGAFDGLKNARKNTQAARWKRAQDGHLWDKNSYLNKKMAGLAKKNEGKAGFKAKAFRGLGNVTPNKLASWATDPMNNTAYYGRSIPGLKRRGAAVRSALHGEEVNQTLKLAEEMNGVFGPDDKAFRFLHGGLHGGLSAETQEKLHSAGLLGKSITSLDDFNKVSEIAKSSNNQQERVAAMGLESFKGKAATLFQDPEMARASIAGAAGLGLAMHGFYDVADVEDAPKALAGARADIQTRTNAETGATEHYVAGFEDVEDGFGFEGGVAQALSARTQQVAARSREDAKNGYAFDIDSKGNVSSALALRGPDGKVVKNANGEVSNDSLRALQLTGTMTADAIMNSKSGIYKKGRRGVGDAFTFILEKGDTLEAKEAAAEVSSWSSAKKAASESPTSPDYATRRIAYANEQHEAFTKKMSQIVGSWSRGATDNTTAAMDLVRGVGSNNPTAQRILAAAGSSSDEGAHANAEAARIAAERAAQEGNQGDNGGSNL